MKPTPAIVVAAVTLAACIVQQEAQRPAPSGNGAPAAGAPAAGAPAAGAPAGSAPATMHGVGAEGGGSYGGGAQPGPTFAQPPPEGQPAVVVDDDDGAPAGGSSTCGRHKSGTCPTGEVCRSCSAAVRNSYFCARPCSSNADCPEAAKPSCEHGYCSRKGGGRSCRNKCAAPDTPILTPSGERAISSLREGDLVYSLHGGRVVAVPIVSARSTPARDHQVVRVTLAGGAMLLISPEHPTADGRTFDGLAPRDRLGEAVVVSVESVAYPFDATYDILPDSDSGAYFAAGALVGSTLLGDQEPYLTEQP